MMDSQRVQLEDLQMIKERLEEHFSKCTLDEVSETELSDSIASLQRLLEWNE